MASDVNAMCDLSLQSLECTDINAVVCNAEAGMNSLRTVTQV